MLQPGDAIKSEDKLLKTLVERIRRGKCVLVLGPRVAVRADDPERTPLDELLAIELSKKLGLDGEESEHECRNLRHVAELYYRQCNDLIDLQLAAEEFYTHAQEVSVTTPFHQDLAQLPFQLCICASPDDAMFQAFSKVNKSPQRAHYNFRENPRESIIKPSDKNPLVYHLFGHYKDSNSLVLTEGDLIDFLVAIVKGAPALPDQVRSMLVDEQDTAFLFVGFGFHNWYLRVLLKVIGVYHHKSKQVAFEDTQFFSHPECKEAVGFFSGERHIEFRHMQWEQFARQMRDLYFARKPADNQGTSTETNLSITGPLAFLSYASEDRDTVGVLANQLEARGIAVWQDKQNFRAGDEWSRVLVNVIEKRVNYFIIVQTSAMLGRIKGVFNEEIDVAIKQQKSMGEGSDGSQFRFVIPVKIGECNSFTKLEGWHAIDVGSEGGVDKLTKDILDDWTKRQSKTAQAQSQP
jgi:hypothetical protein